jgi:mono/diheme cytochrome c family protein
MKTPTNIVRAILLGFTLAGCGEDPLLLAELIAANDNGEETSVEEPTAPSAPTVNQDLVEEPAPAPPAPDADESRFVDLMVQYCAACHQTEPGFGDIDDITDVDQLIANDIILPGNREDSPLYVRIVNQSMPPQFIRDSRPSPEEIDFIGAFIDSL